MSKKLWNLQKKKPKFFLIQICIPCIKRQNFKNLKYEDVLCQVFHLNEDTVFY